MNSILKFCLLAIIPILCMAQPLPTVSGVNATSPGTAEFYPSGIWHKNMELKCNVNFDYKPANEFLDLRNVNTMSGTTILNSYKILATGIEKINKTNYLSWTNYQKASHLKFYNVTNINNGITNPLNIRVLTSNPTNNTDINNSAIQFADLTFAVMYQNPSDNHTYCVTKGYKKDKFIVKSSPLTKAKAIIIDLTEAMNLAASSGNTDIVIGDLTNRSSAFSMATPFANYTNKVYIGYISYVPEIENIHTLGFDNPTGILAMTSLWNFPTGAPGTLNSIDYKSYVDLIYFRDIDLHANYSSTTAFVVPTRISESGINGSTALELKVPPTTDPITGETGKTSFITLKTLVKYKMINNTIDTNKLEIFIAAYQKNTNKLDYLNNLYVIKNTYNFKTMQSTYDTIYHKITNEIENESELNPKFIENTGYYCDVIPKQIKYTGNEIEYRSKSNLYAYLFEMYSNNTQIEK